MNLHILWFVLIVVLFTGFFLLEGFDYGVGILLPFLGKNDGERRMIFNAIGPFWDGNEVWLVTAGGAMFAAFPNWYATLFSSFYLEMFLILIALILRGAAFEFRSKREDQRWRTFWDWMMFAGSLLPGFLCGVVLTNLIIGIPIDAHMNYVGGVWTLFNPYALLGGVVLVALFTLHGAVFLNLRVSHALEERAHRFAKVVWLPTLMLVLLFITSGYFISDVMRHMLLEVPLFSLGYFVLAALVSVRWFLGRRRNGLAFVMTALTILLSALTISLGVFPHVMFSSLHAAWSLTIDNAASSDYTLMVMSWTALTLIPFVLLYQGWTYWIFRKRLDPHVVGHY